VRGRVILTGLALAGLIGLLGRPAPAGAATGPAAAPRTQAVPARPAPCRVENAVKALQARRKLAARLDKCQRRLINCHEKRDRERNRISLREVVGGLGWIFGLCGLGLAVGVLWRDRQRRTRG
jgi:hypothetical protein